MRSIFTLAPRRLLATAAFSLAAAGTLRADDVTDWHETLVALTATANPVVSGRDGALLSASVFDAVNGIERRYAPIRVTETAPRGASKRAAAVEAAYTILVARFPAQAANLAAKRTASLAAIDDGESENRGVAWGRSVAQAILAWRSTDGFTPPPPNYFGGTAIGQWRSTAPLFLPAAGTQFANMTPWGILSPDQFLPAGPPALDGEQYLADFEEVKAIGRSDSAVRTGEQTDIAQFWEGSRPVPLWNRAALRLSAEAGDFGLSDNARLFAMLNLAIADGTIACWNAKYHYEFWRPDTAIQQAEFDGVDETVGDPTWTPLLPSHPHPDYPSGHCSASSAASAVLEHVFGANVPFILESTSTPGLIRNYPNFAAARSEVADARVFLGIHFRTACNDALAMGQSVADYLFANKMQRLHGDGE
ncbi:MAG TPA: vanadium-dependent haloperoxidase [Planctomycetia bacterium]|nr:vanadium-dependent haloperoxidase [Planctomycetia bacterium]